MGLPTENFSRPGRSLVKESGEDLKSQKRQALKRGTSREGKKGGPRCEESALRGAILRGTYVLLEKKKPSGGERGKEEISVS